MRITHSKSSRDAKNYYAFSDYYDAGPSQLKGHWFGRGATLLGLEGEVDKELFDRLIDNKMPFDDERLTARNRADRRVGTDLTLSAPKSVSLLWGVTQDNDILEAVQQAAFETLVDVEQDAQTRVNHERGKMTLERTSNILGGMWIHTTSRPVDGYPDMNLHAHCFVVNATKAKDRWTAVDLSAVVRDSGFYEAVFQSRLASRVGALGYPIERSERDFEIAGISRATIDKFSRRTALIEKIATEKGITDADEKGKLGAQTRDKKSTNLIPQNELPDKWREQLTDAEAAQLNWIASKEADSTAEQITASHAVDFATQHCFEREAVIRERQLLRKAILRGIGTADVDAIRAEVAGREWIQEGYEDQALISTREVLSEEQRLLSFARQGRGQVRPLAENHCIKQDFLSDEQQDAVKGLLSSHDQVQILRGVAGSGKTTMMRETIDAIEQRGRRVTVLAPTAEAAHDVLRAKEGFDAETLASFLIDKNAQESAKDGVIWVDEAALVGTRDMAAVPGSS